MDISDEIIRQVRYPPLIMKGQGSKTITALITIGNGAPSALQEIVIFPPTGPRVSAGSGKR